MAALMLAGCGGSGSGHVGTTTAGRLPAPSWVVSFDVRLAPASRLQVGLGYGDEPVTLASAGHQLRIGLAHGARYTMPVPRGWLGGGSWHVEATNDRLAVDGRLLPVARSSAASISFRSAAGSSRVSALIVSAAADRGALLLHRLAELHARIPARRFPVGSTLADRIVYGSTYWTNGFWAGALWQAAAMGPDRALFARWALTATIQHFGQERADTHDVGFMYGESSLAAWEALCRRPSAVRATLCARLKRSVLSAANELLTLAASNPGAGTIPTNTTSPQADTIVDSMMNIAILPWATEVTGDPKYARLAAHHAREVERLLVRPDGSTAQAVNFDRHTGRVLSIGTHQGLSNHSTWSRGEGWAVYGFAQAAADLRDRGFLRVALRVARFIAAHLPSGGIPRWDYNAPPGAPVDVSAGVISAAGLFHLAAACRTLTGVCTASAGRWAALGRRMLAASLERAGQEPPLGLLRSQVLNEHGHGCWCNRGELIFGLTYGLEGVRLRASS
jgi:unsaturated chondroitin disaccharide hydrolase